MNYAILGWICTSLFGLCYIPQILHTYRTKTVKDVSIGQWFIQLAGYLIGFGYGVSLHQAPLIFGYAWGAMATTAFITLYFKYKDNSHV